ncbi:hypothetical protein CFC21_091724 [Triticum aestivum]|uniref:Uncharacterized protein n=2 Tax=Triticum aestivum TaxID=4565 RepID=A0A9R1LGW8_WHEAT|nr:hypothetical protein CFC21_091724 [Triticum aestivum]
MNYADIEEQFNNMALEGPSAQDGMDCIVSLIISCLPPPLVPAPEADDSSDSDDDHFSLTASDSEDADADGPAQDGDGQDHFSRLPRNLLSNIMGRRRAQRLRCRARHLALCGRSPWPHLSRACHPHLLLRAGVRAPAPGRQPRRQEDPGPHPLQSPMADQHAAPQRHPQMCLPHPPLHRRLELPGHSHRSPARLPKPPRARPFPLHGRRQEVQRLARTLP